jgi:hypothetical protein
MLRKIRVPTSLPQFASPAKAPFPPGYPAQYFAEPSISLEPNTESRVTRGAPSQAPSATSSYGMEVCLLIGLLHVA